MRDKLSENVAFESRDTVEDGFGNHVSGDWTERFTTRAHFTYLRGSEAVIAARLEGRQPIVVRVRASKHTRLINNDWRMRDVRTGVIHAVRTVIPTDDRQFFDITTESGVAS